MNAPDRKSKPERLRTPGRFRSLWQAFSSLKLAVAIMLLLAAVMAAATFYEAKHTSQQARDLFYHTTWFNGLLILLAINIFSVTMTRWPFKIRHSGFVLTHLAILVILGGAVVTLWFGTEGTLRIREGTELDAFSIEHIVVAVERVPNATSDQDGQGCCEKDKKSTGEQSSHSPSHPEVEVPLSVDSMHPARGLGKSYSVKDSSLTLKPLAYYPNSEWEERYLPDPSGHPAAELVLSSGTHGGKAWLHTAPGANDIMALGRMRIQLTTMEDEADLAHHLSPPPSATSDASVGKGWLSVSAEGSPPVRINVSEALGQSVEIPGTGAKVTLVRYIPHAMVAGKGKGLITRSERPVNPAVVLKIAGEAGTDERTLFARFPDMAGMHRKSDRWPLIKTAYEAPYETPKQRTLRFLVGPEDQFHYALTKEDGSVQSGPVKLGEAILPEALGVSLSVGQYLPAARAAGEPRQAPVVKNQGTRPALNVLIMGRGEPKSTWLVWGRPAEVQLADQTIRLLLRNQRETLPFRVKLEKFEEERYPGLQRAAMWRSHVTVNDPTKGLTLHRVIQMNEPLRYAGYTFFQSSFDLSGPAAVSVLTVSRDPGKWIVYGGFALLIVGVAIMVMTKRVLRRRSARG